MYTKVVGFLLACFVLVCRVVVDAQLVSKVRLCLSYVRIRKAGRGKKLEHTSRQVPATGAYRPTEASMQRLVCATPVQRRPDGH